LCEVLSDMDIGAPSEVEFQLRRKEEEPVNPFASGPVKTPKKSAKRNAPQRRSTAKPKGPVQNKKSDDDRKRLEALKRMKDERMNSTESGPAKAGGGERSSQTKAGTPRNQEIKQETREDRFAEIERKKRTIEGDTSIQPAAPKMHESGIKPSEEAIASVLPPAEPENVFAPKTRKPKGVKPGETRPRRRSFREKKGGGRQPQMRKLDRRKYLEYKYEVRDLLDEPSIPEESRSNVLGQIWAKGERIGVQEAIEFINTKEQELILPEEIAQKLRDLVKGYATKR